MSPIRIISTLWGVWLLGWILASVWTAKTVAQGTTGSRLGYSVFIWAGALLLFVRPDGEGILHRSLLPQSAWTGWTGAVLVAFGLSLAGWARAHLGRLWSGYVTLKADHAIVRSGPYGLTRHPIYTGLLLALFGTAVARGSIAALAGFILVVIGIVLKIRQEEQLLLSHFGVAYQSYRKDVPALIPWLRVL